MAARAYSVNQMLPSVPAASILGFAPSGASIQWTGSAAAELASASDAAALATSAARPFAPGPDNLI